MNVDGINLGTYNGKLYYVYMYKGIWYIGETKVTKK